MMTEEIPIPIEVAKLVTSLQRWRRWDTRRWRIQALLFAIVAVSNVIAALQGEQMSSPFMYWWLGAIYLVVALVNLYWWRQSRARDLQADIRDERLHVLIVDVEQQLLVIEQKYQPPVQGQ